jgi:ribonuclease P protein component
MGEAHPNQGPSQRYRLPPSSRITRSLELRGLLRKGKKKKTSSLDVFFLSSGLPRPRVGVIVPKYGFRVVDRNLLKRRMREVLRREVLPRLGALERSVDVLVRARKTAYATGYHQIRKELVQVTEELCSRPSS